MKKTIAVFLFIFVAAAACGAAAPVTTSRPNKKIMIIAHRTTMMLAPENTIPGIMKAIELGCDYIELDVRYTKDGVPVLMHDPDVMRTTNGIGPVSLMSFKKLRKLDAGARFGDGTLFRKTRIPTLEEALEAMQGKIRILFEHKAPPRESALELVKKYGFYPDKIVLGSNNSLQKKFLALDPSAPARPYVVKKEQLAPLLAEFPSSVAIKVLPGIADAAFIDEAHARGVLVFVNTLTDEDDTPEVYRKLIDAGADAIQTNHPDVLKAIIEEMNK